MGARKGKHRIKQSKAELLEIIVMMLSAISSHSISEDYNFTVPWKY